MTQTITPWSESLDPQSILPEYPRPQMVRDSYVNLNGVWSCSFSQSIDGPQDWQDILVPFSPEAPLSGVGRTLKPFEHLWYRRNLPPMDRSHGSHILLHFGAIDQQAEVFVNDQSVAVHMGGYTPFTADITDAMHDGENELLVRVEDDTDASWHSRGKQKTAHGGAFYAPQSGIWQTVWMERVPSIYITGLRITPKFEEKSVEIVVSTNKPSACKVVLGEQTYDALSTKPLALTPEAFHPWTPEDPYLYDFSVVCGEDSVKSYFALREVCVKMDEKRAVRLYLNGKPYFQTGLLDQGRWPDGLYTAPSDEAMVHDIQLAKSMGFNTLRKHVKIEPLRWYYHCDRLGMLVWQDMINGGRGKYHPLVTTLPLLTNLAVNDRIYSLFSRQDPEGREEYRRELAEMVRHLYNSPSVVVWTAFNEGWGQFDSDKAVELIRELDSTRPIDPASGWNDRGCGDIKSLHSYARPCKFRRDKKLRCVALSEFGGYGLQTPGHMFSGSAYCHREFGTADALMDGISQLYEKEILPAKARGLSAAILTQLSDVEDEIYGLTTYDRQVVKVNPERIRKLNERLSEA